MLQGKVTNSEDVFAFNLVYKFYTSNAICKDNAAINCITVQHKKVSFPLTLTGQTLGSIHINADNHGAAKTEEEGYII
jgi:hypothetical protein